MAELPSESVVMPAGEGLSPEAAESLNRSTTLAIIETDLNGRIQYCNAGTEALLGWCNSDLQGQPIESILPEELRTDHLERFKRYVRGRLGRRLPQSKIVGQHRVFSSIETSDARSRYLAVSKHGSRLPISLTIHESLAFDGSLKGFVGCILDERKQDELRKRIQASAEYDDLTGLLCWRGVRRRVRSQNQCRQANFSGQAVLYIDIDHFSGIAFRSKKSADSALVATAQWMKQTLARLHPGDGVLISRHFNASEFLVVIPGDDDRILSRISKQLLVGFHDLNLGSFDSPYFGSISVGLATFNGVDQFEFAVASAARSCAAAKSLGHDRVIKSKSPGKDHYAFGDRIRDALTLGTIELMAQRILPPGANSFADESFPLRFEVLTRLREPGGTLLPTEQVFAVAERLGTAHSLDLQVLIAAFDLLARYPTVIERLDHCAINLSGSTVSRIDSCTKIEIAVRASGIDPSKLCFELTESAEISDAENAVRLMEHLRSLGCKIAIDDFGTGHSNYQSLVRGPIDCVKIDGSYTRRILHEMPLRVDFEGMLASAKIRGIEVVAEVVESCDIAMELVKLGVDWAQGYHLHRPEPLRDFLELHSRD